MKAAVFESYGGQIAVQQVDVPEVPADGVLIQVEACGICRSDWHGWMGHDRDIQLPHVPGHELAGRVDEVGASVRNWQRGQRVTVPFCCGCGSCEQCRDGCTHICDEYTQPGFTQWGGFAEYVVIRHADVNLVTLPEEMDAVTAASLGCRFATAFRGVVDQGRVSESDTVAVFGCGGVGLSAVLIAKSLGARVIAVDIGDEQLERARMCGADFTINSQRTSAAAAVRDASDGGASVTVDALGSRQTCFDGIAALRKRGRHIQIGLTLGSESDPPVPMSSVIAGELEVYGSHGMPAADYPRMLEMIAAGQTDPSLLTGDVVSLEESCERLMRLNEFKSVGGTIIRF